MKCLTVFTHFSPKFVKHLYDDDLEIFIMWVCFTLLSSSEILSCSLIWNIFLCQLILSISVFIFICLVAQFLSLGEGALCRRCTMGSSSALPSGHQGYML